MTRRRGPGEGSITPRSDGRWQVRVDLGRDELGRRRRKYLYAATQAEAVKLLRRAQRDKEQGRLAAGGRDVPKTLGAWLDQWLGSVKATREPKTYERYESAARIHITPALGHRRLTQVTPLEVQRFLDALGRTHKPNGVRAVWIVLSSALGQAERKGLVSRNVASRRFVDVPSAESTPDNVLSLSEAKAFLAGVKNDRLYALFLMAVVLGQRQGSLLGLRWSDVAEDYSRVRFPMKLCHTTGEGWQLRPVSRSRTKKAPRSLPLPAPVAAALRQHRTRQQAEREAAGSAWTVMEHEGKEVELVFAGRDGRPVYGAWANRRFQQCLAKAGLDKRRFHDLRHSAATVMMALRIPIKVISEVLAHAGIQITGDYYMVLDDDELRRQLAVLDGAWGDEEPRAETAR